MLKDPLANAAFAWNQADSHVDVILVGESRTVKVVEVGTQYVITADSNVVRVKHF